MNQTLHNSALRGTVTFLDTARSSRGRLTEIEVLLLPGGGNPPHYHRTYDEAFTIIEGSLQLKLAGRHRKALKAGETYVVTAGNVHSFYNDSDRPVQVRCRIMPANEGFENSLRIMAGLATDGCYNLRLQMPSSFQALAVCMAMSDTWVSGPLAVLNRPLRLLAHVARWRGVERKLKHRYCI